MAGIMAEIDAVTSRSLRQLQDRVGEYERRADDLKKIIADYESKTISLEKEIEDKTKEVKSLKDKIAKADADIASKEQASIDRMDKQAKDIESKQNELEKSRGASAALIAKAQNERAKVQALALDVSNSLSKARSELGNRLEALAKEVSSFV